MTPSDASTTLEGDVWQFLEPAAMATELVREYFFDGDFSGAWFESFCGAGDAPGNRHRFGPEDLLAVSLLGVRIPGWAAITILDRRIGELNALLSKIPATVVLHEADPQLVTEGSPADGLSTALESIDDVGWVTAAKLLARKRPHLLPVYDEVVKAALAPNQDAFWIPLWSALQDRDLVERLAEIRQGAGLTPSISIIRVLDVAIWMRNRGTEQVVRERGGIQPLPFAPRKDYR